LTSGKAVSYAGKDFGFWTQSALKAIDYRTGKPRWEYDLGSGFSGAGILTTTGGILVSADTAGNILVLDAAAGKTLWHTYAGGHVDNSPITYELDGRQYLLTGVNGVLCAWALPEASLGAVH
jgi:alcohol dehydrogenase (cytochrome c)